MSIERNEACVIPTARQRGDTHARGKWQWLQSFSRTESADICCVHRASSFECKHLSVADASSNNHTGSEIRNCNIGPANFSQIISHTETCCRCVHDGILAGSNCVVGVRGFDVPPAKRRVTYGAQCKCAADEQGRSGRLIQREDSDADCLGLCRLGSQLRKQIASNGDDNSSAACRTFHVWIKFTRVSHNNILLCKHVFNIMAVLSLQNLQEKFEAKSGIVWNFGMCVFKVWFYGGQQSCSLTGRLRACRLSCLGRLVVIINQRPSPSRRSSRHHRLWIAEGICAHQANGRGVG